MAKYEFKVITEIDFDVEYDGNLGRSCSPGDYPEEVQSIIKQKIVEMSSPEYTSKRTYVAKCYNREKYKELLNNSASEMSAEKSDSGGYSVCGSFDGPAAGYVLSPELEEMINSSPKAGWIPPIGCSSVESVGKVGKASFGLGALPKDINALKKLLKKPAETQLPDLAIGHLVILLRDGLEITIEVEYDANTHKVITFKGSSDTLYSLKDIAEVLLRTKGGYVTDLKPWIQDMFESEPLIVAFGCITA